jgi:hypothetical protein
MTATADWQLSVQPCRDEAGRLGIELFVFQRGTGLQRQYALFGIGREGATQEGAYARRLTIELDRLVKEDGLEIPDLTEQRDATDKGREVCPLRLPLMGAVVEGGLCS